MSKTKRAPKRAPRPAVEDDGDATEPGSEVESEPELVDCWTPEPKPLGPTMPVAAADTPTSSKLQHRFFANWLSMNLAPDVS